MISQKEFQWIAKAKELLPSPGRFWQKAIGDDAAVWTSRAKQHWVLSQDSLIQDVHFRIRGRSSLKAAGFKALSVNLSDLAAMGALPRGALLSLALPSSTSFSQFKAFYEGIAQASQAYGCPVVGGDLCVSPQTWMVSVTVLGEAPWGVVGREGARPGQNLWVSGNLGEAALGLKLLEKKSLRVRGANLFKKRQLMPEPRLDFAKLLVKHWKISSLMDLSDGLYLGLEQLAEASQVGFQVDLGGLKLKKNYRAACQQLGLDPWELALGGGEDYELLWTISTRQQEDFSRWVQQKSLPFYYLGEVKAQKKIHISMKGQIFSKKPKLFKHF